MLHSAKFCSVILYHINLSDLSVLCYTLLYYTTYLLYIHLRTKHGYLAREDLQSNLPSATSSEALLAPGVGCFVGAVELESLSFGHSLLGLRVWRLGGLGASGLGLGGYGVWRFRGLEASGFRGAGIRAESLGHFGDFRGSAGRGV